VDVKPENAAEVIAFNCEVDKLAISVALIAAKPVAVKPPSWVFVKSANWSALIRLWPWRQPLRFAWPSEPLSVLKRTHQGRSRIDWQVA